MIITFINIDHSFRCHYIKKMLVAYEEINENHSQKSEIKNTNKLLSSQRKQSINK